MADQTQNHELRDEDVHEGELENHLKDMVSYLENRPKILFVSPEEAAERKVASDKVMRDVENVLNRQKYIDEIRVTADNFELEVGDEKEY